MRKSLFIIAICLCIVLSGCGVNKKEYAFELSALADKILDNGAEVEGILNQYAKVWSFTIKSRGAIEVSSMASQTGLNETEIKEYFEVNALGNIPDDFSMNIDSMSSYFEDEGKLDEIRNTSKEIKEEVSELNNPPSEHEKAYDELLDLYTYSDELTSMALRPTGSLQSFNEDRNRLTSEILSKYKKIKAIIPDDE